jgi:tyramine---L-glutamate ligase
MRDALLSDLSELLVEVITTLDARLAAHISKSTTASACVTINANDDVWQIWAKQMQLADMAWIIAPETDGLLHKLTCLASLQGALILGCGADIIAITSSKLLTYLALKQATIATIATYTYADWLKLNDPAGAWISKPVDGAGCEDTLYFESAARLKNWLLQHNKQHELSNTHIIQPFVQGTPASISCIFFAGKAKVLSCNKQLIHMENNALKFTGVELNGMQQYWPQFELIATQIATAMQTLTGFVGIDVMVNDATSDYVTSDDTSTNINVQVIEINPRLTTSYAGMRAAIGCNPAQLVINAVCDKAFIWPVLQRNIVAIHV